MTKNPRSARDFDGGRGRLTIGGSTTIAAVNSREAEIDGAIVRIPSGADRLSLWTVFD